ncbi:ABC transporter ATP-binding protein [Solitalea sp. MAHUQ-68]|uniref:ABC transporter ATP-binding protein n=1 Tax=Solitalea agri TaxID=2953739 RepID=A0A9X2F8F3_9SPHI|nr:ABC transporter ATP-binding protein [Solitalea agri]MCO4292468.1 ABC transporter ATP-binding protein [Solitalea agri]
MLAIRNLHKQYPGNEQFSLKNIHLDIKRGEIVSLVGASGGGKSTLLKLIYGILDADSGEILFNDKRVYGPSVNLLPGAKGMHFVQQDYNLNPYAKVYDNIAPVLPNTDLEFKKNRIHEILELLNIFDLKDKQAINLSGGQQQRVAIARALASGPDLLLLDEPFSNLDVILKNHLKRDLEALVEKTGISILMVTHDSNDALSLSHRIIVMQNGQIVQVGCPKEVYNRPKSTYVARLFGAINIVDAAAFSTVFNREVPKSGKLLIHPHDIGISSVSGIPAKILKTEYNGSFELIIVEVEGLGRKLQINYPYIGRFKAGEQVFISVMSFAEVEG